MRISDWSSDVCSSDLFFEGADPAQAGRGGQPDHLRQFDIGDPAVFLEFAENLQVDLIEFLARHFVTSAFQACGDHNIISADCNCPTMRRDGDRKSTRLNSKSLMRISYAVFCLKK